MLLFDCSKEDIVGQNKLLYWFHFLQTQVGPKSPVILVATKIDKISFFHSLSSKIQETNQSKQLIDHFFYFILTN